MSDEHLVIVTGYRYWPYPQIVRSALNSLYVPHGRFILFHGACRDRKTREMIGADRHADDWAQTVPGIEVVHFEADWDRFDNAAGPIRNEEMVKTAVRRVPVERIHGLAFVAPRSRGTVNCMRQMEDHGIDVDEWDFSRARQWVQGVT